MNLPSARRRTLCLAVMLAGLISAATGQADLKIGVIGTDSSHSGKFGHAFNDPAAPGRVPGERIVCAFKGGSPDMERSRSRVEAFGAELHDKYGVALVGSIEEVVARSDAIMILSVDGRAHLPRPSKRRRYGRCAEQKAATIQNEDCSAVSEPEVQ